MRSYHHVPPPSTNNNNNNNYYKTNQFANRNTPFNSNISNSSNRSDIISSRVTLSSSNSSSSLGSLGLVNKGRFASNARQSKGYFDDDDDDDDVVVGDYSAQRIGSVSNDDKKDDKEEEEEIDPLEAFMLNVQHQIAADKSSSHQGSSRQDIEIVSGIDAFDDPVSSSSSSLLAAKALAKVATKATIKGATTIGAASHGRESESSDDDSDDEGENKDVMYDSDGNLVGKGQSKARVVPLPPIDHSTIQYSAFRKEFYRPHADIVSMSTAEVRRIRGHIDISVQGSYKLTDEPGWIDGCPAPIETFEQAGFNSVLLSAIKSKGFESPTAIQAQSLPVTLSGHDLIGLAKTGSGKTFSFIWPMIVQILAQPNMQIGDGPVGLILAPTRELAAQIHLEAKQFCKLFNIRVCPIFGGSGKWEMQQALQEAPEIVVATPGRLIEMIRLKATNLRRVTMLVLDEADRMFEMGFEYQMRSIVANTRPDRQTLLFSATMKKKIEGFAREILRDPIRIVVGHFGQSNPDIQQKVLVVNTETEKWWWLSKNADDFVAEGKVLIFVSSKNDTDELATQLRQHFLARQLAIGVASLHGDKDQTERSHIMRNFAKIGSDTSILVATDIASRGLDVKDIRTVINYNVPKNIDTYVHRIGRTGRMGVNGVVPGTAFTLIMPTENSFAVDLVNNLRLSGLPIDMPLLRLAESNPRYRYGSSDVKRAGQGRSSGRSMNSVGIGFAQADGSKPTAMTSAMMASTSIAGAPIIPSSFSHQHASDTSDTFQGYHPAEASKADMAANPYIEGRALGRGKHLTQPSWASAEGIKSSDESAAIADSAPLNPVPIATAPTDDSGVGTVKRKSRFSAPEDRVVVQDFTAASIGLENHPAVSAVLPSPAPASAPLKGFVRAAATLSSISVAPINAQSHHTYDFNSSTQPTKRNRWGP